MRCLYLSITVLPLIFVQEVAADSLKNPAKKITKTELKSPSNKADSKSSGSAKGKKPLDCDGKKIRYQNDPTPAIEECINHLLDKEKTTGLSKQILLKDKAKKKAENKEQRQKLQDRDRAAHKKRLKSIEDKKVDDLNARLMRREAEDYHKAKRSRRKQTNRHWHKNYRNKIR
ncbi:MAG: hypothetical protein HOI80_04790 [Alphaproteobacteria bacterium]|nr:hypothetical protein [Alphaproteobacteria bacterium]MBT5540992.1 hypothetical protein [Alphaproteobacteria bacterium]MBT5654796.1 hypothetical protein [Alphaproteobacteria bacterium]